MRQITVDVSAGGTVQYGLLSKKLEQLKARGLMDAGVVLVQNGGLLVGYLAEGELEYGLNVLGGDCAESTNVFMIGAGSGLNDPSDDSTSPLISQSANGLITPVEPSQVEDGRALPGKRYGMPGDDMLDLSPFVDRTPLTICATAPMEYAVEMFGKLGLRYLVVTEQGSGKVVGVIIKKRMVSWIDSLKHDH